MEAGSDNKGEPCGWSCGTTIRHLREQLGMTQEQFAHALAVTVSTVNRWENAHAAPSGLAWRAIQEFTQRHGIADDLLRRARVA